MTDARVTRFSRQVLRDGPAPVRVAQLAREVLLDSGAPPIHAANVRRQVLGASDAPIHVAQTYRTVLRSRRDSPYPNFPVRLFCPPSLSARIEGGQVTGGTSLGGDQTAEALEAGGRWVMEFGETALWDREDVLTWRKFTTACDMGSMPAIIPLWDRLYQPFSTPALNVPTTFGQVVWRDTQVWAADEIQATVSTDAQRHAKQIKFSIAGGDPVGGEHFSVYRNRYGWRLYRLIRKVSSDEAGDTWEIRPPLREWLGAGTLLNFDSPRCTMRCEGDLSEVVELLRLGKGKATFVETFTRYP